MRLVVSAAAHDELLQAQAWYERQSPGLGFEFARAVDVAVIRALRTPLAFPPIETEFRYVLMRRFPYSVIYHPSDSELVVVSFFHHRRESGSWHANFVAS